MEQPKFKDRDFVHLHLHSDYSLLQSTIQLKQLSRRLSELGMAGCSVTDQGNMYGAISFYKEMKGAGLHPIIGYEAVYVPGSRFDRSSAVEAGERAFYPLVLLAENLEGYHNLVEVSSKAFTEGLHHQRARVDRDLLNEKKAGVICLSGGVGGAVWHHFEYGNDKRAYEVAEQFLEIYGPKNFFLEIEDHGLQNTKEIIEKHVEMGWKLGIGLVATNNVHYLRQEDARAHEVLLCIGEGKTMNDPSRSRLPNESYYLRSAEEMWDLFADLPEALTNTVSIAERCSVELSVSGTNLTLPTFPIPPASGCSTENEYFRKVIYDGFAEIKKTVLEPMEAGGDLKYPLESYNDRLELEISVIERMGYAGYFLIVWEFIKYAKEREIPVGPGRGSAAGSLVAYCMGITGIDPIQYDLFFERFLNPERISMPDIDIDFCIRGRGEVINHVSELYGRDSVCQIITFGTMASKAAIKDVGRALNIPLGNVEKIAKMIPPPFRGRNISISQAMKQVPELVAAMDADTSVNDLIELALKVEGCARHTSVHAAGVVISPRQLHELVPVAISAKNELTSQYPMGDLEKVGMLKMDFLGLTTLTIITDCLTALKEKAGIEIDWGTVSLRDEKTMEIFGDGKTDAVFQFESSGMQDICRRLKPRELEDLAALNALYRPGPLDGGMVEDFILRHRGEKKVEYLVPQMEGILKNTYGVLVYQEQIMQLAQELAGYTLGEADMMRRAMGKKKPEEMLPHERKFVDGAVERGIPKQKADEIFKLMAQFADYGFNRSHSIAYAYLAFQTAYLKAHYPAFFYSAVLSHEAGDSAKVYKYSNELKSIGLELLPPDVNESDEGFTPSHNSVRYGLSAIKGLGASSAHAIIEARKTDGAFSSIFDLASRVDQGAVNRRNLESLVGAGAFDSLRPDGTSLTQWRASNFAAIDAAIAFGQTAWKDRMTGQTGLFGDNGSAANEDANMLPTVEPWSVAQLSSHEKASFGFYLSAHPLDDYSEILKRMGIVNFADLGEIKSGGQLRLAGIVSDFQARWSKKGNRFAQFRIEDQSTGLKCLMWSEAFNKFSSLLENDALLIVEGRAETSDGQEPTLIVNDVTSLTESVSRNARSVTITFPRKGVDQTFIEDVYSILSASRGRCEVFMNLNLNDLDLKVRSIPLRIEGARNVEKALKERGCAVEWDY